MEVNENIYPQQGMDDGIIKWTNTIGHYDVGLDRSITFSTSSLGTAPLAGLATIYSNRQQHDHLNDLKSATDYGSTGEYQRIALSIGQTISDTTTFIPSTNSDKKGTTLIHSAIDSVNNTHRLVTGINWQGLLGRMVIFYAISPAGHTGSDGEIDLSYNAYCTTWANFKAYAPTLIADGYDIFIYGVYITDIWAGKTNASGGSANRRKYAITPVYINTIAYTVFSSVSESVEYAGQALGSYRGSRSFPIGQRLITSVNGITCTDPMPGNKSNWLCVWGGCIATAGASAGGMSTYDLTNDQLGGFLYCLNPSETAKRLYSVTDSNDNVYYFYGYCLQVTGGSLTNFFNAMEQRAATYGIIVKTNLRNDGEVVAYDLSHLSTETDIIIPIMQDNGLFNGENVIDGADSVGTNVDKIVAGGINGIFNYGADSDDNNIDPSVYTDRIDLTTPQLTAMDIFNRSFALNKSQVDQFANFIWNANDSIFQEVVDGLALMGENPINGVIDLRLYPFDVGALSGGLTSQIKIGRTNTGISGYRLTENSAAVINLGSVKFFPTFKETAPFLDYEPYTTAELYIPFIGKIPISTAQFVGHTISVKMIVDFITGAGTAVVFCDYIPVIYQQGVVGVSIPITGDNAAAYAQSVIGNVVQGAQSLAGITASVAKGDVGGAIGNSVNYAMSTYQAMSTPTMFQTAGASSPQCALYQPMKPYFVVYRPKPKDVNIYGHTVGYATQKTVAVGAVQGYAEFGNVDTTGINATAEELAEIKQLLERGVYVN